MIGVRESHFLGRALLLSLLLLTLIVAPAHAGFALIDPVDENDGWTVIDGAFTSGVGNLSPSAGTSYWGSSYDRPTTIGLEKYFPGSLIAPGSYIVSVDVSAPFGPTWPVGYQPIPLTGFTELGLIGFAVERQVISAETPPSGSPLWTTWTFRYDIHADSANLGTPLGFRALATTTGPYTVMLDNLRISSVPEPSSLLLGAAGSLAVCGVAWKRRVSSA